MTNQAEELTVNLAIRVTPSMLEALRSLSKDQDRPVGWLVRKTVAEMLDTSLPGWRWMNAD